MSAVFKKIKRHTNTILPIVIIYILFNVNIASATELHNLDIDVELLDGGDGIVTMKWDYTDDKGTEHFIPIQKKGINITDIQVEKNGESYEIKSNWNIKEDLKQKANKAGTLDSGEEIELCWGIGEYGRNEYIVSYKVEGMVKSLTDFNMVYYKFVNDNMSEPPEKVKILIRSSTGLLNLDNVRMWAFGLSGNIQLDMYGNIEWKSDTALKPRNYGTVLLRLDKSIINSTYEENKSFEDYREQAFKGSSYKTDDVGSGGYSKASKGKGILRGILSIILMIPTNILIIFIFILIMAIGAVFKAKLGKRKENLGINKKDYKDTYYRHIPYKGEPEDIYFILDNLGMESTRGSKIKDYISYYFLKWIKEGALVKRTYAGKGIRGKEETGFMLVKRPVPKSKSENDFFNYVIRAAGKDRFLMEKELNEWVKKYKIVFKKFIDNIEKKSEEAMRSEDYLIMYDVAISKTQTKKIVELTEKGDALVERLIGFKNYLLDFSLLGERDSINVHIWDEWMMYAALIGIAEEVSAEFKKVYPDYFEMTEIDFESMFLANRFSTGMSSSYGFSLASDSALDGVGDGLGGGTGFGGGGGSFGGGSGGGTR